MAFNTSDTTWAVIAESTPNTVPSTPAFLRLDYIQGDEPMYTSDFVESQMVRANRTSAGSRKVNFRSEGSLKTHFKRDAAVDLLLESGLSGAWTSNVLKGGTTDKSLTVEKRMVDGASLLFRRFTGMQVSKVGLSCEASGNAELSVDFLGMGASTATAIVTGATYAATSSTTNLTGLDVGTFTVAGLSLVFRKLDLSIEHTRETLDRFGSATPSGIATSGIRKVKLSVEAYRTDWTPETVLIPDTPVAVSFSIGTLTNGYTFTLPAAVGTVPQDSADGSKALMKIDFAAQYDGTAATDISISRP